MTQNDLTERQRRMVAGLQASLPQGQSAEFYQGMLAGYKKAVLTMWQDVDQFWKTDPTASAVTMTALAIEQMVAK